MKANDLKKGDRILLKNGWYATMFDNLKGNIRMAEVEGIVTEIGSIYAADIAFKIEPDGSRVAVEVPAKAAKAKAMADALFG